MVMVTVVGGREVMKNNKRGVGWYRIGGSSGRMKQSNRVRVEQEA